MKIRCCLGLLALSTFAFGCADLAEPSTIEIQAEPAAVNIEANPAAEAAPPTPTPPAAQPPRPARGNMPTLQKLQGGAMPAMPAGG